MSTDPSIWSSGVKRVEVQIPGPPGPPPELIQGTTGETTGAPSATLTKIDEGKYRIDWVLKTGTPGTKGNTGSPGTVVSATMEMIPHDQQGSVTVSGIPPNQTMHFKIPRQTPTPGVPGPAGKLQVVRGVLPDDQTVIDLFVADGPPSDVVLKVLKSTDTVQVSESASGVITFKALGGGTPAEPYKPAQVTLLKSQNPQDLEDTQVIVEFDVRKPALDDPLEVHTTNKFTVTTEKYVRASAIVTVFDADPLLSGSAFMAISLNGGFPDIPITVGMNIPEGLEAFQLNLQTVTIPVTAGDELQLMVQSGTKGKVGTGSSLTIEQFF